MLKFHFFSDVAFDHLDTDTSIALLSWFSDLLRTVRTQEGSHIRSFSQDMLLIQRIPEGEPQFSLC